MNIAPRIRWTRRQAAGRTGVLRIMRAAAATPRGIVGSLLLAVVLVLVIAGPWFTSTDPEALVGGPFQPAGTGPHIFGTDYLGHDTLSRFLHGGRTILVMAVVAAVVGVGAGAILGIIAGYLKGRIGAIILQLLDVLLSFPPLILALLVSSMFAGTSLLLVCAVVALSHVPRTARVLNAATLQLVDKDFVSYAETLGSSRAAVIGRELLPNLTSSVALELGLRTTWSIGIIASLSYLGLGVQPPNADWGLMINENQAGLALTPWPVVLPVIAICVATVGANLLTDAFSQRVAGLDRTIDSEEE